MTRNSDRRLVFHFTDSNVLSNKNKFDFKILTIFSKNTKSSNNMQN